MSRLAQEAILAGLARRLDEQGSWSGETHIQKSAYLMHELLDIPFDFDFILYKHGPFSFELRDELGSMQADRLLERQPQPPPYGPRFLVTDRGRELEQRLPQTMNRYAPALDWIATRVGKRGVLELERLATALWVTRTSPGAAVGQRAQALIAIKPHVSLEDATSAI
ncbi:MAG: hypothetical protein ACHQHO_13900, partial [Solirubrobacterales bacterium]